MAPQFDLPIAAPPTADRERADARRNRERILCAAARLIDARGIDCVSMDDVAAEAGVGKGTLYRRFGDRSSLLRALIEDAEKDFQEAIIRGPAPLGPGAPPTERLHAFGDAMLDLLEARGAYIQASEQMTGGKRYSHPVYAVYRTHVGLLLHQLLGPGARTDYFADCLLAPLAAEPFLHQRRVREMELDDLRAGWHALCDAVLAAAVPAAGPQPPSSSSATAR